jgi:hypothetical protein
MEMPLLCAVLADKYPVQVQRQLQLRIEAQGKYLQKIIEEQQCIAGAGASRANPSSPVRTSESPLQAVPFSKEEPKRSASHDDPLPNGEPLTPDSSCRPGSPVLSPKHERPVKRQKGSSTGDGTAFADDDFALPHHIFESSTSSEFQQCSMPYSGH